MKLLNIILLTVGIVNCFYDNPFEFPFSKSNSCASCIVGGSTFCMKAKENITITQDSDIRTICCKEQNDFKPYEEDPEYFCSSTYSSSAYALAAMCPLNQIKCGEQQLFRYPKTDMGDFLELENLTKGDSCTYEIQGLCGAPSMELDLENSNGINDRKIGITFIEYNSDFYNDF